MKTNGFIIAVAITIAVITITEVKGNQYEC